MQTVLKKMAGSFFLIIVLFSGAIAQELHSRWDELTASEWPKALAASILLYLRPDLVKMDSALNESGANQKRLDMPNVYTAIWWYADYPNHYAGEGAKATFELGRLLNEHYIESFIKALKAIKADTRTLELQNEFFNRVKGQP
jgi:creatinine amidohydrolase/Fe(II)-dependent formamide hydrolase-like protein